MTLFDFLDKHAEGCGILAFLAMCVVLMIAILFFSWRNES